MPRNPPAPESPEGKARASLNALKHGFTSVAKLLPGESQDQFDKLLNGYLDRLCPKDDFERSAIEHIVTIDWQMRRIRTAECCLIDMESTHPAIDQQFDEITGHFRLAVAYERISQRGVFQLANRQLARLSRELTRFLKMFFDLREISPPAATAPAPVEQSPEQPEQQGEQNEATPPPKETARFAWKPSILKVFTDAIAPPLAMAA